MRIAIDLDSGAVQTWAGQAITTALTAKRRDRFPVEVRYVQSGVVVERPYDSTGIFGLKEAGIYTGTSFLAAATAWTVSGYGTGRVYTFDLNLNTVAMEALFAAEPASVSLAAEVTCTSADGVRSSATFAITVANDVIRGDEPLPETNTDLKATQAQAEAGTNNETWMTPLRTAQAIAAQVQQVVNLPVEIAAGWVLSVDENGVISATKQS